MAQLRKGSPKHVPTVCLTREWRPEGLCVSCRGTRFYMAPELYRMSDYENCSSKVDIYRSSPACSSSFARHSEVHECLGLSQGNTKYAWGRHWDHRCHLPHAQRASFYLQ